MLGLLGEDSGRKQAGLAKHTGVKESGNATIFFIFVAH